MNRIDTCFAALRAQGRKALLPFVTAGDPAPELTVPILHCLAEAGADIIELGVPFSDPMADGPVIQRASERALDHHVSLHRVLDMVREFRSADARTPVVLMGYLNPVEAMGYCEFAQSAREAGVDGVLTVDMPPEEAGDLVGALRADGLHPVFLLAPTTSADRVAAISKHAGGFVYYVSLKGVTGASHLDVQAVAAKIAQLKTSIRIPIGVGFGISSPQVAAQVAQFADAVVVGSALVRRIESLLNEPERVPAALSAAVAGMRQAMDGA
jgi:tryptophan synthase alpha chain